MGRRRLTKTLVKEALVETKGSVYLAAQSLDCSHTTIYRYIAENKELAELKEFYDEEATDIAVLKLREAIIDGDPWAVKFQLSTKGKNRGYVERQEVTGADGNDIVVKLSGDDDNNS